MKRMSSRILGFLCAVFIMSSSFSYALEPQKVEKITFEEALDLTIKNNNNLRIIENNLDTQKTTNENSSVSGGGGTLDDTFGYIKDQKARENKLKKLEIDKDAMKESLEFTLKKTIMGIDKSEKSIKNMEANLENQRENFKLTSTKYEYGKISRYDFETEQDKLEKDEKKLELEKKNLESLYLNLDKLLGVNIENRKSVSLQYKYEPLKETEKEIDYKVQRSLEKDPQVYKSQLDIIEKDLNVTFNSLGDENYRIKELSLASSANQLQDLKDNMDKKVRDLYNNIKKNEIAKESLLLDLSTVKKDLEVANKKLELGKTIPQEVKNLEFKKSQIEENLKLNEIDHALLMLQYEKPYI